MKLSLSCNIASNVTIEICSIVMKSVPVFLLQEKKMTLAQKKGKVSAQMCYWQENRRPEVADKFSNEGKDFPTMRFLTEFHVGFWDPSHLAFMGGSYVLNKNSHNDTVVHTPLYSFYEFP